MQWDQERVRNLLVRVEPNIRSYRNGVLGARLGLLLRQVDRDFHPRVLGDINFRALLARFHDLGRVIDDDVSNDFRFVLLDGRSGLPDSLLRNSQQMVTSEIGEASPQFRPEVWAVLTERESSGGAALFVDLHQQQLLSVAVLDDGRLSAPVSDEPERYVRLLPVAEDALVREARSFAESRAAAEVKEKLLLGLSASYAAFSAEIQGFALGRVWDEFFYGFVVKYAQEWIARHGLRPGVLFARSVARMDSPLSPARNVVREPRVAFLKVSQLRKLVVAAVQRMSEEELLALKLPLGCLVERGGHSSTEGAMTVTERMTAANSKAQVFEGKE